MTFEIEKDPKSLFSKIPSCSYKRPIYCQVDHLYGYQCVEKISVMNSYEYGKIHGNPFYRTALLAFNHHLGYVVSPDVLWTQVILGIALHVERNKTLFENNFLPGNLHVRVRNDGELMNDRQIDIFLNGVMDGLFENTSAKKFLEILKKPFSTSSPTACSIFKIGIMDVLKNYTTYENYTACGIPHFDILGTSEDWKDFYGRLEYIERELHMS